MGAVTLETIHKDIEFVKKQVVKIEKHIVDVDSFLTLDDFMALQDYKKEKFQGKLASHEQLKKELDL